MPPITVRMLVMVSWQERVLQPLHLIGRPRRVEHLVEGDAVGGDRRVVAGDDLLGRNVEHLLHHVHLAPTRSMNGTMRLRPGLSVLVYRPKRSIV